jgi:diguanylate cyclase (GGDEF)-like protein
MSDRVSGAAVKLNAFLRALIYEFNRTLDRFSGILSAKTLLERQAQVLKRILLSHQNISQWKDFLAYIIADFHRIFPLKLFVMALSEGQSFSLHVYYLGSYSQAVRETSHRCLTKQMLAAMCLPLDTSLNIEEFLLDQGEVLESFDHVKTILVSVPEHTLNPAGVLCVAYVSEHRLSRREQAVIRSILSVMSAIVDSSRAISRTIADLEYCASRDPLTGLYNRRYFNSMLEYEIDRSGRHRHEFSILLLDIDNFKEVNDSYGHSAGDAALCSVAEVIEQHIRKADLAARLGGDEFAVILMETGGEGALSVAEKLGGALREEMFAPSETEHFQLTVSIGIVTYPHDASNEADLLKRVDIAMYRAKQLGKNSACALGSMSGGI